MCEPRRTPGAPGMGKPAGGARGAGEGPPAGGLNVVFVRGLDYQPPPAGEGPVDLDGKSTSVTAADVGDSDYQSRIDSYSEAAVPHQVELARELASRATPWHLARAAALGIPLDTRIGACGTGQVSYADRDGVVFTSPIWCKQPGCKRCSDRLQARAAAELHPIFAAHDAAQRQRHRLPSLLTLTIRKTGDLAADRASLIKGWARWRAWWFKRYRWSFTFALVPECADGTKSGIGHVHLHVVAWLPVWWDWQAGHAAWDRATEGAGSNIDVQVDRRNATAAAATRYLLKYLFKGLDLSTLSATVAAAWWRATYNKRRLTTSLGFRHIFQGPRPHWFVVEVKAPEYPRAAPRWWRARGPPGGGGAGLVHALPSGGA